MPPNGTPGPEFAAAVRAALAKTNMSVRELSRRANFDHAYLSRTLAGKQRPSPRMVARLDAILDAGGALVAAAAEPPLVVDESDELIELMRRTEQSDIGSGTIDVLRDAVDRLCRDYPTMPGPELRERSKRLMERALTLLDGRTTLAQHRELLVSVGWLACLLGCVHYDVGDRHAAETARRVAFQLGEQAGHGEVIGWSFEMAAWFALTEGRYADVVKAAQAGRERAGTTSAGVQLVLQEAKARARMGDDRAHEAIQEGRRILQQLPRPDHPEHHFVFDPSKWEFYAATIYTLLGWNDVAAEHAAEVVRLCEQPTGLRWPMRLADTRVDLGMLAGRRGDLDEAVHVGQRAFEFERRSGALRSRAADLLAELDGRYPDEPLVDEFRDRLAAESARTDW